MALSIPQNTPQKIYRNSDKHSAMGFDVRHPALSVRQMQGIRHKLIKGKRLLFSLIAMNCFKQPLVKL